MKALEKLWPLASVVLLLVGCDPKPGGDGTGTPPDAGAEPMLDGGAIGADGGEDPDAGSAPDGGSKQVFRVPDGDLRREPLLLGSEPAVVFRYRSYAGSRPSWVSPGTSSIDHAVGAGIRSTSRGAELTSFYATVFDGTDDGYLGDAAVSSQPEGFTIEAWIRPTALDGYRTIFSNTEGHRGFSLKIVDGRLRLLVRLVDGGQTVSRALFDPEPLQAGAWITAAAQVSVLGDQVRLRLYRDHVLVAEESHPALGGIAQSTSRPAVGAEPASDALSGNWFSGELYAVVVHNHPVDHDVLASPQLRDGSRYLGGPSYHDYLDGSSSLAERIARTDRAYPDLQKVRVRFGLPLLNDDWVPQGVAVSEDGTRVWLSGYSRDENGENTGSYASMIAEVDLVQQKLVRVLRLTDGSGGNLTLHVGGLGALDGHLYVPTSGKVHRFRLADAVLEEEGEPGVQPGVYRLAIEQTYATRSRGSFLDVDVDRRVLWVGEFNAAGESRGTVDRYDLDEAGAIARPSSTASDERFVLPVDKVQGLVAFPPVEGEQSPRFLLSTSYGDNPALLWDWTPGQPASAAATLPAGLEDLDRAPDGTVWISVESGASHYQKRTSPAPWEDLTPYLLGYLP